MDRIPDMTVASCAADAEATRSHAQPPGRTKLMAKVTHALPPEPIPATAVEDRDAVVAGVTGIFREIGITAHDLRSWAPWCPALGELADAMDSPAGAS
jgi:hypothetical protein